MTTEDKIETGRKEKIEALIEEIGWAEGKICDDEYLQDWVIAYCDNHETLKIVHYKFGTDGYSFTVGVDSQDCSNSTPAGKDLWSDIDDSHIEYLLSLSQD